MAGSMDSSLEPALVALVRDAAALLNAAIRLHMKIRTPHPSEAELTELLDYYYRMKCEASQTRAVHQEVRDVEKVLALLRSESRRSPILEAFEYAQRLEVIIWRRVLPCSPPRVISVPAGFLETPKRLYLPDGSSRLTKASPCPAPDERMIPDDELTEALAKLTESTPTRSKLLDDDVLPIPDFRGMRDGMDAEYHEAIRYLEMSPEDRSRFVLSVSGTAIEWDELRQFAAQELKGKQRRVIELLSDAGGSVPIRDLASDPKIGWQAPYDNAVKSIVRELNTKLKDWRIERQDNELRVKRVSRKPPS